MTKKITGHSISICGNRSNIRINNNEKEEEEESDNQ